MSLSARETERDRELYNPAIHWFLNIAPAELGSKGTLGGTISTLEHGGYASGLPNTDPYSDYQIGWCAGDGAVERYRKLEPIWRNLPRETQGALLSHYLTTNRIPATDRTALEGELGKLAGAALWVHDEQQLERLIEVCKDKQRDGRKQVIGAAKKRTEAAVRLAHRTWATVAELKPDPAKTPAHAIPYMPPAQQTDATWHAEYDMRRRIRQQADEQNAARLGAVAADTIERLAKRLTRSPLGPRAAMVIQRLFQVATGYAHAKVVERLSRALAGLGKPRKGKGS